MAKRSWPGMADWLRRVAAPEPADPRLSEYQLRGLDDPRSTSDPASALFAPPPNIPMPTRRIPMPAGDPAINPVPNVPLATPPIVPREAPLPEFRPAPITRADEYYGRRDEFMAGTPGRKKSALLGALRGAAQGLATGGGLGGAVGGAVSGGLAGGINPRGLREKEFDERVRPQMLERFRMEDMDAALRRQTGIDEQTAMMNRARLEDIEAGIDVKRSQAERNRLPRPERKQPLTETQMGLHDPITGELILPFPEKKPAPHRVWTDRGMVDVSQMSPEELRKLRPHQRPRAPGKPAKEQKFVSRSQVRRAATENNISESDAAAAFVGKGYRIVN